ncbi:tRNA dihydrouridine synthase DusB [Helicovermis profundi]|uniref:tRNA-dihydrouridine synthase n=1 Tax=Helicovermis profundi TaxID=3065157 RepID=A0AAU9EFA1_9FIRM|nr:tRNA dihydrouridine synthase DusB [Clostridia bacterium S502]
MKIGNIELKSDVILGPMAGVTDFAFRKICKEFGVGLMVSEMISTKALFYNDEKTKRIMKIDKNEKPIALQIFGSDPKVYEVVVESLNKSENDILDINMGCPAPKIVKNGDGSALMKNPKLAYEIMKITKEVSSKPVTVKIRKGWDENSVNAVEIAILAEKAGVDAITIHGRTRDEFYSGKADYNIIKEVKRNVSIPVIGNGDVFSVKDAIRLKNETEVDAIMVARGAQGNPWLIREIDTYFKTGKIISKPTINEIIETTLKHFEYLIDLKGERIAILEMRKHASWYIKGIKNSAKIKNLINRTTCKEDLKCLLKSLI